MTLMQESCDKLIRAFLLGKKPQKRTGLIETARCFPQAEFFSKLFGDLHIIGLGPSFRGRRLVEVDRTSVLS